jgi:hypothetical protein
VPGALVSCVRPSHPELPFGFVVRDALPSVELGKPSLDLRQKHQSFDCVLERASCGRFSRARMMRSRTVNSDMVDRTAARPLWRDAADVICDIASMTKGSVGEEAMKTTTRTRLERAV